MDYFDHCLALEFVNYREQRISPKMMSVLVEAYNQTPENFVPPSKETIDFVLEHLEREIEETEHQRVRDMANFNFEIKVMTSQSSGKGKSFTEG